MTDDASQAHDMEAKRMTISEIGAVRPPATRPRSPAGWVEALLDGGLMRVTDMGQSTVCRKAVGCLLEPCAGDRVALHDDGDGIVYVTAVLERPSPAPAKLRFDRPVTIESGSDLALQVLGDLNLSAGQSLGLRAAQGRVDIESIEMLALTMQSVIGEIGLQAGTARLVCKVIDTVSDRLVQALGHCHRSVQGTDQLRAGHVDYAAMDQLRLHARNALFTADQLSRIDADQIHLG